MSSLKALGLGYSGISDAAMQDVAKLTNLTELRLDYTYVGDAGMAHLTPLTNLSKLSVRASELLLA